jgi:hypothetical protein
MVRIQKTAAEVLGKMFQLVLLETIESDRRRAIEEATRRRVLLQADDLRTDDPQATDQAADKRIRLVRTPDLLRRLPLIRRTAP